MADSISKGARVLVAMSGGVDSSVAAALLADEGYDLVGITMRVASGDGREHSRKACCTADAAHDARRVADKLGIAHYVINYLERFEEEVIGDFVSEYLAGRTPNPCSRCNQRVKFGALYEKAQAVGADYIATGHYVRKVIRDDRHALRRGIDRGKDQSYTLAGLGQEQLRRSLFPLGELTKAEVRERAKDLGLVTWDKPESQEICFVPNDDYRAFLATRVGMGTPGPIINRQGDRLGEHSGLMNYTVGQRKGLGIAAPRPLFVLKIDIRANTLIVGHEEDTFEKRLSAGEVIWSGIARPSEPFDCLAQIRYRHTPIPVRCTPNADGFHLDFNESERSVSPGQWAILYDDDVVLAAGVIDKGSAASES